MKIAVADRSDNMASYKGQFQDLGVKASYRFADRTENKVGDTVISYDDNEADGYSSGIYAIGDSGFKLVQLRWTRRAERIHA